MNSSLNHLPARLRARKPSAILFIYTLDVEVKTSGAAQKK